MEIILYYMNGGRSTVGFIIWNKIEISEAVFRYFLIVEDLID